MSCPTLPLRTASSTSAIVSSFLSALALAPSEVPASAPPRGRLTANVSCNLSITKPFNLQFWAEMVDEPKHYLSECFSYIIYVAFDHFVLMFRVWKCGVPNLGSSFIEHQCLDVRIECLRINEMDIMSSGVSDLPLPPVSIPT